MSELAHQLYLEALGKTEPYDVFVCGWEVTVFPGVFPPLHPDSAMLVEYNDVRREEVVLDMGAGTGIQAIVSAARGASKVVAVDVSADAVENTVHNANKYGCSEVLSARQGDLFLPIHAEERFDLILANLPFEDKLPTQPHHCWVYDYNFELHKRFLREAKGYLKPDGRVLLAFSSLGDVSFLEAELRRNKWDIHDKHATCELGYDWFVYCLVGE